MINLPTHTLLVQLAEEAAELSAAASKAARIVEGVNPSPISQEIAFEHIVEELTDVKLCADTLNVHPDICTYNAKLERWKERLKAKKGDV